MRETATIMGPISVPDLGALPERDSEALEMPMRRRYTALILILVGGVPAIASYCWLASREYFSFLAWQIPVSANDRQSSDGLWIDRSYAFPADFEPFNRRASVELASQGFSLAADDHSFGYRATQYKRCRPDGWATDFVTLYQDMHYKLPQYGEPYGLVGYRDPGWVSVQVHLEMPPSRLDIFWADVKQFCGF
jgi:hypothetical protein